MKPRFYDVMFMLVLPLLIFSGVMWLANIFVPEDGWWILLKMFTEAWPSVLLLGILSLFWAGVMALGAKFPLRIENDNLPTYFIMAGVVVAVIGIIGCMILKYGHPYFGWMVYGTLAVIFICITIAFAIRGMLDRMVLVRIGPELLWLIRR